MKYIYLINAGFNYKAGTILSQQNDLIDSVVSNERKYIHFGNGKRLKLSFVLYTKVKPILFRIIVKGEPFYKINFYRIKFRIYWIRQMTGLTVKIHTKVQGNKLIGKLVLNLTRVSNPICLNNFKD